MKNTTFRNHQKIIKLLEDLNFYSVSYIGFEEVSFGEGYFHILKEQNLYSIKDIIFYFFGRYIEAIDTGDCSSIFVNEMKIFIDFIEENFEDQDYLVYEMYEGNKIYGDHSFLYHRGIRKMINDEETRVLSRPFFDFSEIDYATAIEIEKYDFYKMPFIRINKCNKGYICSRKDDDFVEYSIRTSWYDKNAYGTHYL